MSENSQNKNVKDDEIDLLDLFRRMGRTLSTWGKAIGRAFLISVVFLLRRWLPLGISLAVGMALAYLVKTTSESLYTSDMLIRNNAVPNSDMIAYIDKLHTFCKENNKDALANALSLKPELVKTIKDISAFWIVDKKMKGLSGVVDYSSQSNEYDTMNVRIIDRLNIRVKTVSPQELLLVQSGVISYIKKDSVIQQKNRLRIRQNQELLTRLNYDILQLDSLQKIKYFEETKNKQPGNGGQMIFLQEQKTQLIYTDIYALYARKQSLESERDLYPEVITVLSDFNIPTKPDNEMDSYAESIVPLVFVVTLIILILLANRKNLKEVFSKY